MSKVTRRELLRDSAVAAGTVGAGIAAGGAGARAADRPADVPASASGGSAAGQPRFASPWQRSHDRPWLGADFWANPMQDWRVKDGRAECANAAPDRHVHLLTCAVGDRPGELTTSVRVGRAGGGKLTDGKGSFGFRIGIKGPLPDYRNALIYGQGLNCGVAADGGLFVGELRSAKPGTVKLDAEAVELRLTVAPAGPAYAVTLAVHGADGQPLGQVVRENVPAEQVVGGLALVANYAGPPRAGGGDGGGGGNAKRAAASRPAAGAANRPNQQQALFGVGSFWFADWAVAGPKLDRHPDRAFGPVLFNQYTLHGRSLKMTAQMPPVGQQDTQTVRMETKDPTSGTWRPAGEVPIDPDARSATFRVEKWNAAADVPYRLVYAEAFKDGKAEEHAYAGTVRKDPVDQPVITVADVSCNGHQAFPNAAYVAECAKLDPDLIAFVGDQFYESSGGYGVVRKPVETALLDYLRKWYLHGWTWRELTRDRPSVAIPDDHDVYQGNIWGEGGEPRKGTQEAGGYDMDPRWVNMVHRTHTSHHPDPADPTPVKQGISQFYGALTYGRVSFAILADRMYKSAPEGKVPPTGGRGDHVKDPTFDPKAADLPGLQLLGDKQTQFLRDWAADWRGADLKAVLSQTIFTGMATTHGAERMRLRVDYDQNGWPQRARNEAVRAIRSCFAVHIAGDQHLPAVVRYGVDAHGDAGVAFAGPAVNVTYPRWWEPNEPGKNRKPGSPENTGDFADSFNHPLTVLAVAHGKAEPRRGGMENLIDKASGLGVVRLDKAGRSVTFECWPLGADVSRPGTQFPGWPVTVSLLDPAGRKPAGGLPAINMKGNIQPVVQVYREGENGRELVYALRPAGERFEPFVFEAGGKYTVRVGNPDLDQWREFKNLEPVAAGEARSIEVKA